MLKDMSSASHKLQDTHTHRMSFDIWPSGSPPLVLCCWGVIVLCCMYKVHCECLWLGVCVRLRTYLSASDFNKSNQSAPKDLLNYLDDKVIIRSSSVLVDEEEMNLVNHAKPVHLATQVIIDSGCSRHVVRDNFSKYFTSRTNIKPVYPFGDGGNPVTSSQWMEWHGCGALCIVCVKNDISMFFWR